MFLAEMMCIHGFTLEDQVHSDGAIPGTPTIHPDQHGVPVPVPMMGSVPGQPDFVPQHPQFDVFPMANHDTIGVPDGNVIDKNDTALHDVSPDEQVHDMSQVIHDVPTNDQVQDVSQVIHDVPTDDQQDHDVSQVLHDAPTDDQVYNKIQVLHDVPLDVVSHVPPVGPTPLEPVNREGHCKNGVGSHNHLTFPTHDDPSDPDDDPVLTVEPHVQPHDLVEPHVKLYDPVQDVVPREKKEFVGKWRIKYGMMPRNVILKIFFNGRKITFMLDLDNDYDYQKVLMEDLTPDAEGHK